MSGQTDYAVGDVKSDAKGSGARANRGKPSFSLVPMHTLAGAARVFMGGKLKYAPYNWAKGMAWSVPFDCLMRHMFKWFYFGEELDQESGEHHLDYAICNLLMLRHYIEAFKEGDDRPNTNITNFSGALSDFNQVFDLEDFLDRNPAIRKKLEKERQEKEDA